MKTPPAALLAVLASSLIAGCGSSPAASAAESEAELAGEHHPAAHCEVFVDRIAPYFTSHGVEQITVYLKTPVDKLGSRGGVRSVGFHTAESGSGLAVPAPYADRPAMRFATADDYWTLRLNIGSDMTGQHAFEGAFYVEANDGTRFWLNASEGGRNFVIDPNMLHNLQKLRPPGFFSTHGSTSPETAIHPANEFPYLNAQRCR